MSDMQDREYSCFKLCAGLSVVLSVGIFMF